eukprot:EG_transcript_26669
MGGHQSCDIISSSSSSSIIIIIISNHHQESSSPSSSGIKLLHFPRSPAPTATHPLVMAGPVCGPFCAMLACLDLAGFGLFRGRQIQTFKNIFKMVANQRKPLETYYEATGTVHVCVCVCISVFIL